MRRTYSSPATSPCRIVGTPRSRFKDFPTPQPLTFSIPCASWTGALSGEIAISAKVPVPSRSGRRASTSEGSTAPRSDGSLLRHAAGAPQVHALSLPATTFRCVIRSPSGFACLSCPRAKLIVECWCSIPAGCQRTSRRPRRWNGRGCSFATSERADSACSTWDRHGVRRRRLGEQLSSIDVYSLVNGTKNIFIPAPPLLAAATMIDDSIKTSHAHLFTCSVACRKRIQAARVAKAHVLQDSNATQGRPPRNRWTGVHGARTYF